MLIAARNAEATIGRAIASCRHENLPMVLIDDNCTDATAEIARASGATGLRIIDCPAPGGIPLARQAGLDAVTTRYAAWLDADDEWLPGRAQRITERLEAGFDVYCDSIALHDGKSGALLRTLTVPDFIFNDARPMRLFERNYLPGDTQVGFRVETFRAAGGYDPAIFGPESYDLLLRAVMHGATFAYERQTGYRMYAYADSVSRNLARQRDAVKQVLRKHDYASVEASCRAHGYPNNVTAWLLTAMAMYREEPQAALRFVEAIEQGPYQGHKIIEPGGPCPLPEAWRVAFYRGTALLLTKEHDELARQALVAAEAATPTAEAANNLGVALRRLRQPDAAEGCFAAALSRYPDYRDALVNSARTDAQEITTHPLRRQPSRSEYHST